jgi:hypothetical protein
MEEFMKVNYNDRVYKQAKNISAQHEIVIGSQTLSSLQGESFYVYFYFIPELKLEVNRSGMGLQVIYTWSSNHSYLYLSTNWSLDNTILPKHNPTTPNYDSMTTTTNPLSNIEWTDSSAIQISRYIRLETDLFQTTSQYIVNIKE